ncbi:group III truncated hemoglobin, partial [Rhodobacteraceae bacterium R_SAG6]|nr:group III truncated hemoglobin [Rhodobacteraceae bacterium R_SAG6]
MSSIQTSSSRSLSARPSITAALEARTGLDDEVLRELVHAFYGKIRKDPVLGPIFAARIDDWPPHLDRMTSFWSSVALMTG